MKMHVKPTLNDISRRTGLSLTTAASILRGDTGRFPERTVRLVQNTAKNMNYRKNFFASILHNGKFNTLLLVMGRETGELNRHLELISGIYEQAEAANYALLLEFISTDYLANPQKKIRFLSEQYFDGILLNFVSRRHQQISHIENRLNAFSVPLIWINQKRRYNSVYPDDLSAGRALALNLQKIGKRRALLISSGVSAHYSIAERVRGFSEIFREKNDLQILSGSETRQDFFLSIKDEIRHIKKYDCIILPDTGFIADILQSAGDQKQFLPDIFTFGSVRRPFTGTARIFGMHYDWYKLGSLASQNLFALIDSRKKNIQSVKYMPEFFIPKK